MTAGTERRGRITEDETTLRELVAAAEIPALLAALACALDEPSILDEDLRPPQRPTSALIEPQGGMSQAALADAREVAVRALLRLRDGDSSGGPSPEASTVQSALAFLTGDASAEHLTMLRDEIPGDRGIAGAEPAWRATDLAPGTDLTVAVIGAGMSGLAAAYRLLRAEVPFVVLERSETVGGTWRDNRYPGCRLDTNNFAYSYSFAPEHPWTDHFSTRDAILDYFRHVAGDLDLQRHVRLGTEVVSATWDDDALLWRLAVRGPDGVTEELTANAVISAVGQLNRPHVPDIPGRDRFAGLAVHSARWTDDTVVAGRRVAVIGTGASAYQIVPSIVDDVAEMRVFQRHAPWMLPTPNYHDVIAPGLDRLFDCVPGYRHWFRVWQFWNAVEGRLPFVAADPDWTGPGSVSAANELLRDELVTNLHRQFADRPDLLAKVVPDYPPGAKRMVRDNGVWADALKRDHVDLVCDPITGIEEHGVRTADGVLHEADVIVYATGFVASDFLGHVTVTGTNGMDLAERWDGDPRAYLGITVPRFPNLFLLYGPNTNLVVNGSAIVMTEYALDHVMECLRTLLADGTRALVPRQEAEDEFVQFVDAATATKAWGASDVSSWYRSPHGRVSQNWPLGLLDYWRLTRRPDPAAYEFLPSNRLHPSERGAR